LRPSRRGAAAGFTLLELLVVLALLALVTGLVAPTAGRSLAAARERAASADVHALLEELPLRSFRAGTEQTYTSRALNELLPGLPNGWVVEVTPPLRYAANGVAAGGTVRLLAPGRPPLLLKVLPVSGEVARPGAAP
jgi:prepilin-type N-terminal cleavage/methylation domain-containing protein